MDMSLGALACEHVDNSFISSVYCKVCVGWVPRYIQTYYTPNYWNKAKGLLFCILFAEDQINIHSLIGPVMFM